MAEISPINATQSAAIKKINFKQCTAQEIKRYQSEGQDVPDEIARWAAEVAKIANAPDDVTYEMVNGEVDENQLASLSGEGPMEARMNQADSDSIRSQYEALEAQIVNQTDEATGLPYVNADQKSALEQLSAKMTAVQNTTTEKGVDFSVEIKGIEELTKLAPLSNDDAKTNEEHDTNEQAERESNRVAFGNIVKPDTKSPEKAVEKASQNEQKLTAEEVSQPEPEAKTTKPEEKNDIAENDKLATDPNEILKRKMRRGQV